MRNFIKRHVIVFGLVGATVVILCFWLGVNELSSFIPDSGRSGRAKMDIINLECAVETHKAEFGDWPATLEMLTRRTRDRSAYLADQSLVDPWGELYKYDPATIHPKTGKPLIWTEGQPGTQVSKITNWELKRK